MVQAVVVKKLINAPREKVYEAWTKPELMKNWLYPGTEYTSNVQNELKAGGSYKISMTCKTDGKVYEHWGNYKEISIKKLVFSWNSEASGNSKVTVELKDKGSEGTKVIVHHENIISEEEMHKHLDGWKNCMTNLENLLSQEAQAQSAG